MKITIDTNVFVYMLDARNPAKQQAAIDLVEFVRPAECSVALQVCSELYAVLTRKLKRAPWEAAQASRNLLASFDSFGASRGAVERALAEASAARFAYWDALLLASSHEAGCTVCFSEDMHDGVRLGRVEVIAPFDSAGSLSARARKVVAEIASG